MDKKPIKDFNNRIIGYIETDDKGNKICRDFYNRILGYYQKSDDTTRDFYKRIVSRGDTVVQFLYQNK